MAMPYDVATMNAPRSPVDPPASRPAPSDGDAADTRSRMLDRAFAVLEADGEQAIRVRDVAAAAGVTYSAVDHHFGGRNGLIEAAYLESYRRDLNVSMDEATAAFDAAHTFEEFTSIVEAIVVQNMGPARAPARRLRAIALGAAATRPGLARQLRELESHYVAAFSRMLDNPRRRGWVAADLDIHAFASIYIGFVSARFIIEMAPDGADGDAWNHLLVRALLAALTDTHPPVQESPTKRN